jgi:Raf kinase inhibitor-like YbhB/YbcL family protein
MGRTTSSAALAALALTLVLAGCGGGGGGGKAKAPPPSSAAAAISLTSPAFAPNSTIPTRFTCAGAGAAPPLAWRGVPASARALALTVEDPDAPGGTFVHWVLYDVPPTTTRLTGSTPPPGAREARNGAGSTGWTPPCPPPGDKAHRYVFTLYALRAPLGLPPDGDPGQARDAIARAALARGQLTGTFRR